MIKDTTIKAVLDTGANISAINRDTAKRLNLRRSKRRLRAAGIVGSRTLTMTKKTLVEFPGLFDKAIAFAMYKDLESIEVILGMDFLAFPVIQFDYINSRLRFATPNVFNFNPKTAIPLRAKNMLYYLNVIVDDVPLEMLLDTGNAGQIIISSATIDKSKLFDKINSKELKEEKSGLHKKDFHYYESMTDNFQIGPHVLWNVSYKVVSEETPLTTKVSILGYDILKNFIVTLNMFNQELYLTIE
ncbi:MAG: hypothetical protein GY928_04215 [Colwellia sp.]|nr:hypothetical protein [Colwellia sp.]